MLHSHHLDHCCVTTCTRRKAGKQKEQAPSVYMARRHTQYKNFRQTEQLHPILTKASETGEKCQTWCCATAAPLEAVQLFTTWLCASGHMTCQDPARIAQGGKECQHTRNGQKLVCSDEALPSSVKRTESPEERLHLLLVDCNGSYGEIRIALRSHRSNGQAAEATHKRFRMLSRPHQHLAGSSARWIPAVSAARGSRLTSLNSSMPHTGR